MSEINVEGIYYRVRIAHNNPNNYPLIDRAYHKARMALGHEVGFIMDVANAKVKELYSE